MKFDTGDMVYFYCLEHSEFFRGQIERIEKFTPVVYQISRLSGDDCHYDRFLVKDVIFINRDLNSLRDIVMTYSINKINEQVKLLTDEGVSND